MIPLPYKIIGLVLLALSIFSAGYLKGTYAESDRHTKEMVALQVKYDQQVAHTNDVIKAQVKIAKDTENEYQNRIADIRNYYGKLQHSSGNNSSLPANSQASTGANAIPPYDVLVEQCTETTQQLVSLQGYIVSVIGAQ